ncbi:MAG: hypothetical protein ACKOET_01245 [Verrucomicrobiota bacterium]
MDPAPPPTGHPATSTGRFTGEVVYLFAFDIAYEMDRQLPAELLGQAVAQYSVDRSKRSPRHLLFFKPRMVRLPAQERLGPHGPVRVETEAKILAIGALSIRIRVPFAVERLSDLVAFHDLRFSNGSLADEVRQLAARIRQELAPSIVRPIEAIPDEEAYTVFCLRGPLASEGPSLFRSSTWLDDHRREVAALLTQEPDVDRLSDQETVESTSRSLSYYEDDLVVADWDAALIVDEPAEWEESLYVLELANLQLAELEAYDRILDGNLERSYRDLANPATRSRQRLIRELRELRIDMARFSDELSNISKFFGDWHLARLYEMIGSRFHLADWHRSVNEKLRTVGELHEILKHDQSNRWMMILEITIVLLFVIDLVMLFYRPGK